MSDLAEPTASRPQTGDLQRLLFWGALAVAAGGAGVAIAAGESAGGAGAVLLIALGAALVVFLTWMARGNGRAVGLFPDRGAAEAAEADHARNAFAWIEALDEPALVADRAGSPQTANASYWALTQSSGALVDSDRPPHPDRLFGADPLVSPAMFRLAKAANAQSRRREELPPSTLGDGVLRRFTVSVSPMSAGRVLWRLSEFKSEDKVADASLRELFIDHAPIGFLSVNGDGVISYANVSMGEALGRPPADLVGAAQTV
jgi:two-component system cell cycle sensor histidine kinase/response regulator CckA